MKIHVLKKIRHDKLGLLVPGSIVDLPEKQAEMYLSQNAVERYQTKVIRQEPFIGAGETIPLSASPAGQALTKTTLKKSKTGVKAKSKEPSL
jgi:hypothetical protein